MELKRITGKECESTRTLWEEVFYEDSRQFTDYYFKVKANQNIGYVIGKEPYDAMMFRTPYDLQIGGKQKEISYLVGVATRKECRHKGYMTSLLKYALEEMYGEKQPFTFLMPANPAIYEPFDFRYIYEQDIWSLKECKKTGVWLESLTEKMVDREVADREPMLHAAEYQSEKVNFGKDSEKERKQKCEKSRTDSLETKEKKNGLYSVTYLKKQGYASNIMEQLACFSNKYLYEHYNTYVIRDVSYYERQLEESQAQNGDIFVWLEQGQVTGFFLYAREEDEVFIQEVMEQKEGTFSFLQKAEKKKPIIMARIVHLEEMLKLLVSDEPKTMLLEVKDDLLIQNNGIYCVEMTSNGSVVTKLKEAEKTDVVCNIRELTDKVLTKVFLNEIV